MVFDIENGTHNEINLKYPEIYWKGNFGIPKIYLSKNYSNVLVSFSLDPKVYSIDIKSNNVKSIEFMGNQIPIEEIPIIDQNSKKERLDFIQFTENRFNQYGYSFQATNGDLFRLLRPGKPEKKR